MCIYISYIASIVLVVAATFVLTRHFSHRQLRKKNEVLSKENERLRNENYEYVERTKGLLEDYRPMHKMRENMKTVAEKKTLAQQAEALQQLLVANRVWPKGCNEKFVDNIFRPLKHELESIDQTNQYLKNLHLLIDKFYECVNLREVRNLIDWDKAQIRANLLRLAFQLMDGCQSIKYFNYVEAEQGINKMLINKEFSNPGDAEAKCNHITDLEAETPRWARVLKAALSPWLTNAEEAGAINSSPIILRGYLFNKYKYGDE